MYMATEIKLVGFATRDIFLAAKTIMILSLLGCITSNHTLGLQSAE